MLLLLLLIHKDLKSGCVTQPKANNKQIKNVLFNKYDDI